MHTFRVAAYEADKPRWFGFTDALSNAISDVSLYTGAMICGWVSYIFLGYSVKTGSSRSGTDERGKCDNVGLSAACPSNEATIRSVVVAVA